MMVSRVRPLPTPLPTDIERERENVPATLWATHPNISSAQTGRRRRVTYHTVPHERNACANKTGVRANVCVVIIFVRANAAHIDNAQVFSGHVCVCDSNWAKR